MSLDGSVAANASPGPGSASSLKNHREMSKSKKTKRELEVLNSLAKARIYFVKF
jgi:hypothetical protein